MKVKDFLKILQGGAPTVRIIDANVPHDNNSTMGGVMLCEYLDAISSQMGLWSPFEDCEVLRFRVSHEVSHKQHKELGLIPPFRPDLTAEYDIGDLSQKTYYDIYIDGAQAKDGWQNEIQKAGQNPPQA